MAERFQRFACGTAEAVGSHRAFLAALLLVAAWAVTGPFFHYSDTWQLVINTGTTVVTFLMVFLIQSTQNRDSRAIHLKLDELIRSQRRARNVFAELQHATDAELDRFEAEFRRLRYRARARHDRKTPGPPTVPSDGDPMTAENGPGLDPTRAADRRG